MNPVIVVLSGLKKDTGPKDQGVINIDTSEAQNTISHISYSLKVDSMNRIECNKQENNNVYDSVYCYVAYPFNGNKGIKLPAYPYAEDLGDNGTGNFSSTLSYLAFYKSKSLIYNFNEIDLSKAKFFKSEGYGNPIIINADGNEYLYIYYELLASAYSFDPPASLIYYINTIYEYID